MSEYHIVVSWVDAADDGSDVSFYNVCLYKDGSNLPIDDCTVDEVETLSPSDCCEDAIGRLCADNGLDVGDVELEFDI